MASSIVGLLITTIAFSGLVLSYQYVEESYRKAARYPLNKNELDIEVEGLRARVESLEKMAHPSRDFVICDDCKCKVVVAEHIEERRK